MSLHDKLTETSNYLYELGYSLTDYGAVAAGVSLESDYSPAETASIIALTAFSAEVKAAGDDILVLAGFATRVNSILRVLKLFKETGAMRQELWANDARAFWAVAEPSPDQLVLVDRILANELLGKQPVAYPA